MDKQRRDELLSFLLSLTVVAISMYPLYRDDLARLGLRARSWLHRRDTDAELMAQVQREISLMEHGQ